MVVALIVGVASFYDAHKARLESAAVAKEMLDSDLRPFIVSVFDSSENNSFGQGEMNLKLVASGKTPVSHVSIRQECHFSDDILGQNEQFPNLTGLAAIDDTTMLSAEPLMISCSALPKTPLTKETDPIIYNAAISYDDERGNMYTTYFCYSAYLGATSAARCKTPDSTMKPK